MDALKRPTFTAVLAAVPCSPQMREQIRQMAKDNNTSEAQIVRVAVQFFLDEYPQKIALTNPQKLGGSDGRDE